MTGPRPDDELLRRYHEASAQDARGPGAHVREAVRAHAQAVLAGQTASSAVRPAPAANQPRWKLSLLASVAVVGLAGLLVLQFERGTPEEKELVAGQSAAERSPVAPAAPAANREATPAATTAPEAQAGAAPSLDRVAPARSQAQPARALPPAPAFPAPPPAAEPAPASVAPAIPAEVAPPRSRLADADANSALDEATASVRSAETPAAALRAAPAAAPRAQAQQQKQQERASERAGASALNLATDASLHAAAGAGRLAQVEQLISQGAAINAPDAMGRTPLILAAIHGHSAVVQRLLALGANPALADRDGLDALQHARRLGRQDIVRMMEAGS